jgi:hypothetical protein
MELQLIAVVVIVAAAAAFLIRATWKTWTGKKSGCVSGCGKCGTPAPSTPEAKGRISLPQV